MTENLHSSPKVDLPPLRVMALHALTYCERLFYLEEVEEIRVADQRVYAGRTLHGAELPTDGGELVGITLESAEWDLKGQSRLSALPGWTAGPLRAQAGAVQGDGAWDSDRLQVVAYAALLSSHLGRPITEGRIRYHANNKTVRVAVDDAALADLRRAITRARTLAESVQRPPVAANENLCAHCSLAPVCLPEEERYLTAQDDEAAPAAIRLFPEHDERQVIHVTEPGSRVGKQGEEIVVTPRDGDPVKFPGRQVGAIVLHGAAQISSQTIHYALAHHIGVHWLSGGGQYAGGDRGPWRRTAATSAVCRPVGPGPVPRTGSAADPRQSGQPIALPAAQCPQPRRSQ
jgi:CRISPR-associated protein Cas1